MDSAWLARPSQTVQATPGRIHSLCLLILLIAYAGTPGNRKRRQRAFLGLIHRPPHGTDARRGGFDRLENLR